MNRRYSSWAVALMTLALLTLSACSDSLPPVANTPLPLPEPVPTVLPPVIRCAPDATAATAGHTQLASDCAAAATGAAS